MEVCADTGARHQPTTVSAVVPPIIFVQAAKVSDGNGTDRFPDGSRIVLLAPGAKSRKLMVLTPDFLAAADPHVSFDGKRVLFAAQKTRGQRWQVWEMNLDGSGTRQITTCESDCVRPAYLPADEIVYTSVEAGSGGRHSSLQIIGLDGSNSRSVTFGPGDWWLETVLRDGRILASANSPLADAAGNRLLYTVRPDGTGLESFRCEHNTSVVRGDVSELEDGSVVFTEGSGALMIVRRGALREERIGAAGISYKTPAVANGAGIMVATKPAKAARYQLATVASGGHGVARTIYSDPQFDSVAPVAVQARPVPKRFWSNLIPSSMAGYFISLDSSNSIDKPKSEAPIRSVRVIEHKAHGEVVLGEAPVESDGSFYVKVPANQPVRFVLLDEHGAVIREEHGWVWTRPGEQRGCTGCHGDKALAPQNRWPLALRRKDPPTDLSGKASDVQTVHSHDQ
jgi:hypothetical protein